MKKTTLWIVALLAVATLSGCNKTSVENLGEESQIANPASVYCEENGGTLKIETAEDWSQAWICMFEDGSYCEEWSYKNGECQPGEIIYNTVDEENIDTQLPGWAKTSLTDAALEEVIDTHFPKWYTYSVYNTETEESNEWEYTYPEDLSHTLLLPIHATMASREVTSSWIEDGMIYTLTNITLQDDTQVSVLYIVDPVTLNLVAANVENGKETTNYQFVY